MGLDNLEHKAPDEVPERGSLVDWLMGEWNGWVSTAVVTSVVIEPRYPKTTSSNAWRLFDECEANEKRTTAHVAPIY